MESKVIFAQPCGAMGIDVMISTIKHQVDGIDCFATGKIGVRSVVGYYSGNFFYQNLYGRLEHDRLFEEQALALHTMSSRAYYLHISKKLNDPTEISIMHAFCP